MSDEKKIFFSLPMQRQNPWQLGGSFKKNLHLAAGIAVEAVTSTGQQVFAQSRIDERGVVWTDYYTLHPEGIP